MTDTAAHRQGQADELGSMLVVGAAGAEVSHQAQNDEQNAEDDGDLCHAGPPL